MDSLQEGQEMEVPPPLESALQNLALHGLVDAETETRH
jgi:hypothetical protein